MSNNPSPELLEAILPIIKEKGLKAATMDYVARQLKISKRTLYEIFENKSDMIMKVYDYNGRKMREKSEKILNEAPNVMVALSRLFEMHRDNITGTSMQFFADMDNLYPELKSKRHECTKAHMEHAEEIFHLGVSQGVFRDDVNFSILLKVVQCQSEAMQRVKPVLEREFSMLEVFDTMSTIFLRSIASAKGHEMLDEIRRAKDNKDSENNNNNITSN